MATMTSTVPLVIAAIKARMDARRDADPDGPLSGVKFTTAPSGEPFPAESLQLFGTDGDQAWGALGNRRREETYTINAAILTLTKRGAGEAVWDAVRVRAYAILAELEDELRRFPTLETGVRVEVQLSRVNLDQGLQDDGRFAALDLGLSVKASLVSN